MVIVQEDRNGGAIVWGEFFKEHEERVVRYFLGFIRPEEFSVICESGRVPLVEFAKDRGYLK